MEQQIIYLPPELRRIVKSKAASLGKSISDFAREAFEFYTSSLEKNKETA